MSERAVAACRGVRQPSSSCVLPQRPFGASRARASVAQELAAQVIGVNSFELPGEPSGVDREIIGQLPSGACVATRKSIPRLISGRSAEKPVSDKTYRVWPVA